MNNGDLIDELSRYPRHLPVKVVISEIYGAQDLAGDFNDEYRIELNREDAIEAEAVVHEGAFLLIESK
jgi:hypothetical protein